MASHKLRNYLKTYRKRTGLSQAEVAFLLGCSDGMKVNRYERFRSQPTFETGLALEVIYGRPARELFAGDYRVVEQIIRKRTQLLARNLVSANSERIKAQKLEALRAIFSGSLSGPT